MANRQDQGNILLTLLGDLEEHLTCSICHSLYENPRTLPSCSHIFCTACLALIQPVNNEFACPLCRESVPFPQNGVEEFPSAFLINTLLEMHLRYAPSEESLHMSCPEHRKHLEGYCTDCHEFVCFSCTISLHSGHRVETIPNMSAFYKSAWGKDIQEIRQQLRWLHCAVDNLDTCDRNIVYQGMAMEKRIGANAREVIDQVEKTESHLKEEVKSIVKKRRAVISLQKKTAMDLLEQLQQKCGQIEMNLNSTSDVVILSTKEELDRLKAENSQWKLDDFKPAETPGIAFDSNKSLLDESKKLGKLKYKLLSQCLQVSSSVRASVVNRHSSVQVVSHDSPCGFVPTYLLSSSLFPAGESAPVVRAAGKGVYDVLYTPVKAHHQLQIKVLDQSITNGSLSLKVSPLGSEPYKKRGVPILVELDGPRAVCASNDGTVVVSQSGSCSIAKLDSYGRIIQTFGSKGCGKGRFQCVSGIAVTQNGKVVVADSQNSNLQMFAEDARVEASCEINSPTGIAAGDRDQIYVTCAEPAQVVVLDLNLERVSCFGCPGSQPGQLKQPVGISTDAQGNVYVVDSGNNGVLKFSRNGVYLQKFDWRAGWYYRYLVSPVAIAVDRTNRIMYVTEQSRPYISVFSLSGECRDVLIVENKLPLLGVAVDATGKLYASSTDHNKLVIF